MIYIKILPCKIQEEIWKIKVPFWTKPVLFSIYLCTSMTQSREKASEMNALFKYFLRVPTVRTQPLRTIVQYWTIFLMDICCVVFPIVGKMSAKVIWRMPGLAFHTKTFLALSLATVTGILFTKKTVHRAPSITATWCWISNYLSVCRVLFVFHGKTGARKQPENQSQRSVQL